MALQGSGKTLAFGVPVIEQLLAAKRNTNGAELPKAIRALILAPTRELVMQIKNHIHVLLKYTPFKVKIVAIKEMGHNLYMSFPSRFYPLRLQ